MNQKPDTIRKYLFKLSGEDPSIISQCGRKVKNNFTAIGIFVLFILICCFLSAFYFTDHLFQPEEGMSDSSNHLVADIGVGLVWGYMVTNMYILLLYTITPNLLPVRNKRKGKRIITFDFSLSMAIRLYLVAIFAIVIAQPLNILIFRKGTTRFVQDIKELLGGNVWAWLITLLVVLIFLLPIYLKYSIRKLDEFYAKKKQINIRIVQEEYNEFKSDYEEIFKEKINSYNDSIRENLKPLLAKLERINPNSYRRHLEEIEQELMYSPIRKYEFWKDAPFRTVKKEPEPAKSEKQLISLIYPEDP